MFEDQVGERIPQIDAMREGIDYHLEISLRGFAMTVRPLTIMETMQIASIVQEKLSGVPEHARNRLTENIILAKETLKISSTSDVGKNDYRLTDLMMDKMTPDELQSLFKQYVFACDRVNPILEKMPREQIDQLVAEVKKNPSAVTELSITELVNCFLSLIRND